MIRLAFLAGLAMAVALPAQAELRKALLIGVTDYAPEIAALAAPLTGPGHDVVLMYEVLREYGLAANDIDTLTDRPALLTDDGASSKLPTRGAILAALDRLAESATSGTSIIIYFAGHGAQVPALDPMAEGDGLDEVFLPSDVSLAATDLPDNVIRDDEIGSRIDRMVLAGANVWLIADTCHSGGLRRTETTMLVPRYIDLGYEPTGTDLESPISVSARTRIDGVGTYTGFFGATAGALAYETRPQGLENAHGVLTWALAGALRNGRAKTYHDLVRSLSRDIWRLGRGRAEPEYIGTLAAAHPFSAANGLTDFGVAFDPAPRMNAGLIDGLSDGTRIAVGPNPETPLFVTALKDTGLTSARFTLPEVSPELDAAIRAEGLDPMRHRNEWLKMRAETLVATVQDLPIDVKLRVAMSGIEGKDRDSLTAMIEELALVHAPVERDADITISRHAGRFQIDPAPAGGTQFLSAATIEELAPILARTAKAHALLNVANILSDTTVSRGIVVTLGIATGDASASGACPINPETPRYAPHEDPTPPRIRHCTQVLVTLENRTGMVLDVTPLYLAPDHQIYFLGGYPGSESGPLSLEPGASASLGYTEVTRGPDGQTLATGQMSLLLLAAQRSAQAQRIDLRHLQDSVPPPATRHIAPTGFSALMDQAGFGLASRRSIGQHETSSGGAVVIPIETVAEGADRYARP